MIKIPIHRVLTFFHHLITPWFLSCNHSLVLRITWVGQEPCFSPWVLETNLVLSMARFPCLIHLHLYTMLGTDQTPPFFSWLLDSLSKELQSSVIYIHTARDLLIDMEDRFSQPKASIFFEVQKEISKLSQGPISISSYFTRFKILWDELVNYQACPNCTCTYGSQKSQLDAQKKDQVFRFLMGLNDSYANVRSQILITEPHPGINKVYSLILQEEKHR